MLWNGGAKVNKKAVIRAFLNGNLSSNRYALGKNKTQESVLPNRTWSVAGNGHRIHIFIVKYNVSDANKRLFQKRIIGVAIPRDPACPAIQSG